MAAASNIDACPMEGFDNKKFDEILGLEKAGLESRVLLAVGFRSDDDKSADQKKMRLSPEQVFVSV